MEDERGIAHQYDNAQRIAECGVGVRLDTYRFEDAELLDAIERLLADEAARERTRAIGARLQADPGRVLAADLVERLATS
jgi:UDP:flavonoid glycosyltransferase YjiC (YdhE family)